MKLSTRMLQRLPLYLRVLRVLDQEGRTHISGAFIAEALGFDPVVVRKDLAKTGVRGTPRVGFPLPHLIAAIEKLICVDADFIAVLVGVGKLGSALLNYPGFRAHGLRIVAGFDAAPERCGLIQAGTPVFPISTLTETVLRLGAEIGILTVPAEHAQRAADRMIAAGIKAIWNFTPVQLEVPEGVLVRREDLAVSLAVLLHRLREQEG